VPLHDAQGPDSPLRSAIDFAFGDQFNNLWKNPGFGANWWIRPDFEKLNWAKYSVVPLPKAAPGKGETAPAAAAPQGPLRLENLRPAEVAAAVKQGLPCFVAVGVLENHGNHNPIGCDTFEAQDPLLLAATNVPCVIGPTIWYGPTAYAVSGPELASTDINGQIFQAYARGVVAGLAAMGFRHLVFIQCHQGGGAERTGLAMAIQEYRAGLWARPEYGMGWGRKEPAGPKAPAIEMQGPPADNTITPARMRPPGCSACAAPTRTWACCAKATTPSAGARTTSPRKPRRRGANRCATRSCRTW